MIQFTYLSIQALHQLMTDTKISIHTNKKSPGVQYEQL